MEGDVDFIELFKTNLYVYILTSDLNENLGLICLRKNWRPS